MSSQVTLERRTPGNLEAGGGRVLVIGGGLAGITAALDCARSGARVMLLEARGRLGGAVYSFERGDVVADNGQHVFLRCCTAYRELLERIGAGHLVTMQRRLEIPVLAPGGRRARLGRSPLPAPAHLAPALLGYRLISLRERAAVARAMRALSRVDPDERANDEVSFGSWLAEHGQSAAAIEAVWSLITRPTINLSVDDASLAQAAQVFQVGLLGRPEAADVGHAVVPLSEIHDRTARRALAEVGVEVRLRQGVSRVVAEPPGFLIESRAAAAERADSVVLAVGPERAAKLIPAAAGLSGARLRALGSSPIVNLHVVLARRILHESFAAGVFTPLQWMFDRTESAGVQRGQYLAITLSAADEELSMSSEELGRRYLPELFRLLPAVRATEILEFFVTREHAATFRAAPGARALRPAARTDLRGLAIAGAFTDTGWPATMEGAVRSGHAAADAALESLSLRRARAA